MRASLITLAVGALLGALGGSAFRWSGGQRAWELLTAAFLWTLIATVGTTLGRFAMERLRRGEWRRGLQIAAAQSLPPAVAFLLAAALVGAPIWPAALGPALGSMLVVATLLLLMGVLASPYRR